ncbi:unnamed protein product [Nezara viridula]|uniref:Uncharacterized protein n=1 Tax=Nezara viridula TaxID=85310 RepID=A0A9P0HQV1_NEZVI|nr:unnamed protein product [Nezara viridula]
MYTYYPHILLTSVTHISPQAEDLEGEISLAHDLEENILALTRLLRCRLSGDLWHTKLYEIIVLARGARSCSSLAHR